MNKRYHRELKIKKKNRKISYFTISLYFFIFRRHLTIYIFIFIHIIEYNIEY